MSGRSNARFVGMTPSSAIRACGIYVYSAGTRPEDTIDNRVRQYYFFLAEEWNGSNRSSRQETVMRRKMLEALSYPRLCVLQDIDLRECPHNGLFESSSDRCNFCNLKKECHWLSCINKFAGIETKPTFTIHATLLFGISLVEANIKRMHHDANSCTCESCAWIRDALALAREFETSSKGEFERLVS